MDLARKLTPDLSGVFWFTKSLHESAHFHELDYIFNGLLSRSGPKDDDPSMFFTENFSKKFFLYHFPSISQGNHLSRAFEIISKNNLETRKFLIVDETGKKWKDSLLKKYSNYTFIDYTN